jgi:ubiquinone/menaquinone biosynthesis C-methylase UbiE
MNTFSDPRTIVEQLPIFSGQKIADFGSGSGNYTLLLAKKVTGNDQGIIYAIDVVKQMVEQLSNLTKERSINNVHAIWGDLEQEKGSRLRDQSVNMVLVCNTLFQSDHPKKIISEAHRVLVPRGNLVIVDWSESFGNIGPSPDHVVTEDAAKLLVEESHFEVKESISAGEHHYGFIAVKKA